jgi:hypothetical protein
MHQAVRTIPAAVALAVGLLAGGGVLLAAAFMSVRSTVYPSALARTFLTVRLFVTITAADVALIVTMSVGWLESLTWRWIYVLTGSVIVLTWNLNRLALFRDHAYVEDASGSAGGALDKLKVARATIREASADRSRIDVTLAPGTRHSDVRAELETIAASADKRVIAGGASYVPSAKWGDAGTIRLIHRDVLASDLPWEGPEFADRDKSVTDGFQLGVYADLEALRTYPAGNYETGVMPANTGQGGMTRTGKGVTARVHISEWSTRWDAHPVLLADPRKALQFAGAIRGAIGYHAQSNAEIGNMVRTLMKVGHNRNKALGLAGFDDGWTPEAAKKLGMGALWVQFEEFSEYANLFGAQITSLAQFCLSSGIHLCMSGQGWSHDQLPTSLRQCIGNKMQWGTDNSQTATYLAEAAQDAGVDPGMWGTQFPGRFVATLNGVSAERYPVMAKGLFGHRDTLRRVTDHYGPQMLPYWEGDLEIWPALAERPVWDDEKTGGNQVTSNNTQRPSVALAPAAEVIDGEVESEYDEDGDEVQSKPVADDEIANDVASADCREEVAPLSADLGAIDYRAKVPAGAPTLTREQKAEAFALVFGSQPDEFKFEALQKAYAEKVGEHNAQRGRYYMYEMLGALQDDGMVEKVDGQRGYWRKLGYAA